MLLRNGKFVQHFRCGKICKIVCRVPRIREKSKFLYQDTDVILPADKCIDVRSFVCRNYDKVLMETGKFSDNLSQKMDSCLVLTGCLSRRILRYRKKIAFSGHVEIQIETSTKMYTPFLIGLN